MMNLHKEKPVHCPTCAAIQTKRGFLVAEIKKKKYFIGFCWNCGKKMMVTQNWEVITLDKKEVRQE
jgi:hypothetical protein